mgnify:CR=1 FL=1
MERFCLEIAIHLLRQWLLNNWFGWPTYSRPACRHVSHVECILQCSLQCTKRWRQAVMSVDLIQQTNPVKSNFHHPRYTRQILRKSEMRSFQLSLRSRQVTSKFTFLRVLLRCAVIWRCYFFFIRHSKSKSKDSVSLQLTSLSASLRCAAPCLLIMLPQSLSWVSLQLTSLSASLRCAAPWSPQLLPQRGSAE